ncbi:MAG: hypothetical protein CBD27_07800 [Rhodospirillaceae bacterium TMED167]|nr:glycosyl transferase [Rhodospirillaceae bacterium]OUW26536.1 MAG: hypothetical protein CBD27_07800 [Rhodospirillaceae bacterium TMED167]
MRIAFYAPMKPPDSPVPSGDRTIARSLMKVLEHCGHEVKLATRFQSREPAGDPARQWALRREGEAVVSRLVREFTSTVRPDLWFTYHVYYKAPDWIGPLVAEELGIPYVAAEVSHAPKRAGGPWDVNHRQVEKTIMEANLVIGLNSLDAGCVRPLLAKPETLIQLRPFMDSPPDHRGHREDLRRTLSGEFGLPREVPWLFTAAMMRPGAKQKSYDLLACALRRQKDIKYRLIIAGDGPVRPDIEKAFEELPACFLGERDSTELFSLMAASDLFVWPAVNEAYGMALLEAHSQGLPVVAGEAGGVRDIVRHDETGVLTPVGDAAAFSEVVFGLCRDPLRLERMSRRARLIFSQDHTLEVATAKLAPALEALVNG